MIKYFAITLLVVGLWPLPSVAQPSFAFARNAAQIKLLKSATGRDLHSLLRAIDSYDQGNLDVVRLRGLQGGGPRVYSTFGQIVHDERIRKIYGSLKSMSQGEAATVISKSYQESLSRLKNSRTNDALVYGLHAKLWLSLEFDTKENFNEHFADWYNWHVESVSASLAESVVTGSKHSRPNNGPELLMYLNLVLIDQVRKGDGEVSSKFSKLLVDSDLTYRSFKMLPIEYETNDDLDQDPLTEIPVFNDWGHLGGLDAFEQSELVMKARDFVDEERGAQSFLDDLISSSLALNTFTKNMIRLRNRKTARSGTIVEFLGAKDIGRQSMKRAWDASVLPPLKADLTAVVERLLKSTAPNERAEWKRLVAEFKSWLSEVPEDGIEVNDKKVWEWSNESDEESEDIDEGSRLVLRLTLSNTEALRDELSQEVKQQQADALRALIESRRTKLQVEEAGGLMQWIEDRL